MPNRYMDSTEYPTTAISSYKDITPKHWWKPVQQLYLVIRHYPETLVKTSTTVVSSYKDITPKHWWKSVQQLYLVIKHPPKHW